MALFGLQVADVRCIVLFLETNRLGYPLKEERGEPTKPSEPSAHRYRSRTPHRKLRRDSIP